MTRPEGAVWSSCGIATLSQPKRKQLVIVLFLKGGGVGEGHVMLAVSEANQKDTPTQVITSDGEVPSKKKVSNRALNQSSLLPVLGHPPDSRTLFTTSELYFILRFIILCLFMREGNC